MATTVSPASDAIARNDWATAFQLLREADAEQPLTASELEDYALTAWWTGQPDECIAIRERAYAAHTVANDEIRAGLVALEIAEDHFHKGAVAMGRGWIKKATSLLGTSGGSVESAWLLRTLAVIAFEIDNDLDAALELAEQAHVRGLEYGDRDLAAVSLHDRGRIVVARGDVEEGMALMDEAMVAAVGGELGAIATGRIYCNMIDICEQLADYRRAGDWSEAAKRWCERSGNSSGFPGVCRIHRAEIMKLRGEWSAAEEEARRASRELGNFVDFAGEALYEVGEIRLNMGDFDSAEEAFRQAHGLGRDPQPGLAQLQLVRGKVSAAYSLIAASLEGTVAPLKRARLLPTVVEAALALEEPGVAGEACRELRAIADEYGTNTLVSHADHAEGTVAMAGGDTAAAISSLRRATDLRLKDDLPYLAARSRVQLAVAYAAVGEGDLAELELSAARVAFAELGAAADATMVARMLDESVVAGKGSRRVASLLFTDIVDSTALISVIGDEAWEQVLRWHNRTLRALFADHGGREVENTGDGFFVSFEEATQAVRCAIEVQWRLAQHRREEGFAPQVRIGIHSGEVTEISASLAGEEVHKAARVCAHAGAGEILCTSEVAAQVPGIKISQPRLVELKGFSESVEVVTIDPG